MGESEKDSPHIKRWSVIERELSDPWFHVRIKTTEEEMEFERTLLVSDVGYLERVLNEVTPFGSVISVMVMNVAKLKRGDHDLRPWGQVNGV